MKINHFLAFDLGATSGRTILGTLCDGKLEIKELTRFPNRLLRLGDHYYWNIFSLYESLKEGLATAAKENVCITSIGIDTWGVDFAFIGKDGSLMGLPYAYRDPHTFEACTEYFEKIIPREEVYNRTGIQIMNFNSLFQLYARHREEASQLASAKHLLFMPDALSYLLCGEMVTEYTIASTSQLLNAHTRTFDTDLLKSAGISTSMFNKIVMPGTQIGTLRPELAEETGLAHIPIVAVAGHDTASAIAAIPASNRNFAYLSSGTWSLMGIEVSSPVINKDTYQMNVTNEGGVEGTIRLLKNITGMWLVEQCMKEWEKAGRTYNYSEMVSLAEKSEPFRCFINPDDAIFANPESMTEAITEYCIQTGQTPPSTDAEYFRTIFDSLALKYREVLGHLQSLADFPIEKLHVIGGGSRNRLLSQMTANAIGIPVITGPSEATAIGNVMLQAKAAGLVSSLQEMRNIITQTVTPETFLPEDCESWNNAYYKYINIITKKQSL